MIDQFWWYMVRSSGVVAWGLSFTAILVGILMSGRVRKGQIGRPWLLDLHRFLSSLTAFFIAVHLFSLWADDFVDYGLTELFVPFQAPIRNTATAWGIGAFWIFVVVEATSLVRDRLPKRVWHGIHLLSYATFVMGTQHAVTAGTDLDNRLLRGLGWTAVAIVVAATVFRILQAGTQRRRVRERSVAASQAPDPEPAGV